MRPDSQPHPYIDIINKVVKPAVGCTEPIAAAYAAAVACRALNAVPDTLQVWVSDNLYKNAMGVFVPGTGKTGLAIAAAAGAVAGNPDKELEVLGEVSSEDVTVAQALIDAGKVTVERAVTEEFIYCKVIATQGNTVSLVEISGGHTNVIHTSLNGHTQFQQASAEATNTASVCDGIDISIEAIYDFALHAEFESIRFILDAAEMNDRLSQEGLANNYGLEVGRTLQDNIEDGLLCDDLSTRIQMRTSAASDARMGGASLPAMSNYGSGNQGIAATLPVVVTAEQLGSSDEQLARALIMSHLGAIYIKSHYPPLSAFCGNTVTSAAAAMAMVYLSGGSFEQSCYAIQNVLSDSSGMVCDGAKSSCAMKVCTSSTAAVRAFLMARRNKVVSNQGIVAEEVEATIANVGCVVNSGMQATDSVIIDIMSQ
ncbi:serine dehydratase subunit alpha family protein [Ferrimonas sp. SCSIO 43195]|uniref:L-cysteine desulfidase family protein n=1 Tax=Ferrimonas sp. SCSIO 43195 TaxID=2822844 RepID=UPI0020756CB8|nr:L-serine ammonia-lyase, iron-sulfur-dependent, subunit alpha [Ferrimonas sp. SCSIO 43195]USD36802.1 serine dehydratase subunit alpha family protein [Ferrimonas sp. SCSIO 43195]